MKEHTDRTTYNVVQTFKKKNLKGKKKNQTTSQKNKRLEL